MHSCEVQFLRNPKLGIGRFQQQFQPRSQRVVWLSCALSVHSIRSSCSAYSICTISSETTRRGKRGSSGMVDHPLQNSIAMQSSVVGRDDCSDAVGPHKSKELHADAAAIASEPSRMHTRTALWTRLHNTGYSHGDRPQMAIVGVHHSCHLMSDQMYEEQQSTAFPTPSS